MYIEKKVFSAIFLRVWLQISVWLVLPQQHGWGHVNKSFEHIIQSVWVRTSYVCIYRRSSLQAECSVSDLPATHTFGGKNKPRLHFNVIQTPETIFICRLLCKEIDNMSRKSTNLWLRYLHLMQHLRCVSTLHCKTGKKNTPTEIERVSLSWFMAWFKVPWIQQHESCCVFSRVWLRWVHFKLPNHSQYSSEIGQMESARHSRDDSGNRWALQPSLFWEGSGRTHSWCWVGGRCCSEWVVKAWKKISRQGEKERGREWSEGKAGWNVRN